VGESLEEFLQRLKTLNAECNFRAVTAAQNQEAAIRDAFIAGLSSGYIRQRLLENADLVRGAVRKNIISDRFSTKTAISAHI